MNRKIAILGFGRSGTTWVSDILSKCLGGLILFEPMFPTVLDDAERFCYARGSDTEACHALRSHFENVLNGQVSARWLLRNHVNHHIDEVDDAFLEQIWKECRIIGFKEIRANFLIEQICGDWGYNTLFIVRHPLAVVSSLKTRPWFWRGDFQGLDNHYRIFTRKLMEDESLADRRDFADILKRHEHATVIEKEAVIWAITHKIALEEVRKNNIPLLFYEDLFMDPFGVTRDLFARMGIDSFNIHPAYIFTPSMVTLKTTHDLYFKDNPVKREGAEVFWHERLDESEVSAVGSVLDILDLDLYRDDGTPSGQAVSGCNLIGGG